MLTLHAAPLVRLTPDDAAPLRDAAVAIDGDRIAAIGPLDELLQEYPRARVRHWPGTLGPGLVHDAPVPDAPSPRERIHALLRLGATAVVAARVTDPELLAAARRGGVAVLDRPRPSALVNTGRADLAAFDADGACVATVLAGRLVHRRR
ncbi:imidazolonepropionase-like domain-containing protein [Streptomyces milbemycinicus]|uniref:Imidazolonepropionase-like domain-containing protein n=1 Tax=Streptomyces milbemycinicus TaxID=476552 RepID=A0ABW8LSM2_9ACTN